MLETLHVKNLAIIDEVEVNFKRGLNILTGETGAGKSVIIGSINLALGEKASKDIVRKDAEYGLVELSFFTDEEEEIRKLKSLDIYPEDGQIMMSRRILDGRSICKINGETVPAATLKKVAEILIDIHGQHEHQSLLYKKNHLNLLDLYAKEELSEVLSSYKVIYKEYRELLSAFTKENQDEQAIEREKSLLEFEIKEIEDAKLRVGEDVELESEYRRLLNIQKIMEALSLAYQITGQDGIGSSVGRAYRELASVISYDEEIDQLASMLEDIDGLITDFNRSLDSYMNHNTYDNQTFTLCEQRLNTLNHLKSKYGRTIADIMDVHQKNLDRLSELEDFDGWKLRMVETIHTKEEELANLSSQITGIRNKYAKELSGRISESLEELNFVGAEFLVRVEPLDEFSSNGRDNVEFLIRTNTGEAIKPLEKVASGGELSRIMLALISVCADNDEIETLIFDEIDTGISGRTAQMVAEKLDLIARSHQVICITHLPQIAAMADHHFVIEKSVEGEKTSSMIRPLTEYESEEELARLLGGVEITAAVLENAHEMKSLAKEKKTIA